MAPARMAAATLRFSTISFQKWNGANFASTGEGDHKNQVAEDGEDEGVEDRRTSRAPGQMPT
jgi:hypothetical protein